MSRIPVAVALALSLAAACQPSSAPASARPARPARSAPPPAAPVRLRPPTEAILSDQVVGAPRRSGQDHLTAAQAASGQPDQAAALAEYRGWAWVDAATRSWAGVDETLVLTARAEMAARAFDAWAASVPGRCSAAAGAGLDGCRLAVEGDRAVVVGRLAAAVFRLDCPAAEAERLTAAQAAALRA